MFNFKRRIKYYLIGFGIGIIFVSFIFGNRACSWLPENRVKNMIAEKEIIVGDSISDLMDCSGVDNNDVYRLLNEDGDVDFSLSNTKQEPKEYLFEGVKDNEKLTITYALFDTVAEVIDFEFGSKKCTSELSNSNTSTVPLPHNEVTAIIESQEMRILELAECQMECLKLSKEDVEKFHLTAKMNAKKSLPRLQPNAIFVLDGKIDGKSFTFEYIIGEARTRVSDIICKEIKCDCGE
jgi:hypothetical protein